MYFIAPFFFPPPNAARCFLSSAAINFSDACCSLRSHRPSSAATTLGNFLLLPSCSRACAPASETVRYLAPPPFAFLPSLPAFGLAGFFAPIVPAFVFLFDRQAPSAELVAAIGKLGGMILAGLTLGSASVGLPFGSAAAVWASPPNV